MQISTLFASEDERCHVPASRTADTIAKSDMRAVRTSCNHGPLAFPMVVNIIAPLNKASLWRPGKWSFTFCGCVAHQPSRAHIADRICARNPAATSSQAATDVGILPEPEKWYRKCDPLGP